MGLGCSHFNKQKIFYAYYVQSALFTKEIKKKNSQLNQSVWLFSRGAAHPLKNPKGCSSPGAPAKLSIMCKETLRSISKSPTEILVHNFLSRASLLYGQKSIYNHELLTSKRKDRNLTSTLSFLSSLKSVTVVSASSNVTP